LVVVSSVAGLEEAGISGFPCDCSEESMEAKLGPLPSPLVLDRLLKLDACGVEGMIEKASMAEVTRFLTNPPGLMHSGRHFPAVMVAV
jgi:hypothetical protein